MARIKLYKIAHARSGDKGEITNIGLFPYHDDDYNLIAAQVTPLAVKTFFGEIVTGDVVRYDLPNIKAFNFVIHGTRPGGVGAALDMDPHGKSLSWALLEMEIDYPEPVNS